MRSDARSTMNVCTESARCNYGSSYPAHIIHASPLRGRNEIPMSERVNDGFSPGREAEDHALSCLVLCRVSD